MGLLALPNSLDAREHVALGSDIAQMISVMSWASVSLSGCPELVGWSYLLCGICREGCVMQHMKEVWVHTLVVCSPIVLGVEVTKVLLPWCPVDQEMLLCAPVAHL
eukprot:1055770-Ditylum_brightwellii.AAC.1